jgi:hypothetical protein
VCFQGGETIGELAREIAQLRGIDDFVVYHAYQQLFERTAAEAVENLANGARGHVLQLIDIA